MTDKRFIEESFPVKEVSEESLNERNRAKANASTIHLWWARKPLASSRATAYAALIPVAKNAEEWNKKRNFIIELCKWENSLNKNLIEKARKDILEANGGKPPRVLDPFAGGGAIPLESLRLGCETYASDYNPVAVLIEKCTLEYPQKYGEKLVRDVKKWGEWVLEEARKELAQFYPNYKEEKKGYFANSTEESIPIGYIWTRTIKCQNPKCEAEIPLIMQFWLAKGSGRKISLYPYVKNKNVEFRIVGTGYEKMPKDFNPNKGTVYKATAECLVCGSIIESKDVRKQFQSGRAGERMIAVIFQKQGERGKRYRIATEKDMEVYSKAEKYLEKKIKKLEKEWGISPVPDEPTPEGKGRGAERAFALRAYSINKWGDVFNSRQKLALITIMEKIRQSYERMLIENYDKEYAKAISTLLAIATDKVVDFCSTLCMINPTGGRGVVHTFGRHTLNIVWTYAETNPFNPFGAGLSTAYAKNEEWIDFVSKISDYSRVSQCSATKLPYEDEYFDAIFTDPPYYDNVPYSYLSDFFYIWLKRSIGHLYPELFLTPLTPKSEEIVAYTQERSWEEAKRYFEDMLKKSFHEIHRVLKQGGIAVIVYAHKTTAGWETVINALLESGLTVSASWPISTEMGSRLRAQESAALASSIYSRQKNPKARYWIISKG
jgi:putative DNA methylase